MGTEQAREGWEMTRQRHMKLARAREVNRERVSPRPATGDDLYDIAGALASANVRG